MNLAISNIAWDKSQDDVVYSKMAQKGFIGLEIAPTRIFENPTTVSYKEAAMFKKHLSKFGIKVVAFQALLFGHPELTLFGDSESRLMMRNFLKKIIDLAAMLEAEILVFGSPKNRISLLDKEETEKTAGDFFTVLGDYAYSRNTFFCIEPNPIEYGANFIITSEEAIDFVKKVRSPGFRLHLDTGTMFIRCEDQKAVISNAMPYLHHIHFSNPYLAPIENGNKLAQTAALLNENKYSRWVSIEMKQASTGQVGKALSIIGNLF